MAGKKKKTTTVVEEIPENQTGLDDTGETSTFDLDLQRADDIETVEQILVDNGISGVTYRFYDNDGGYCYSSPDLDYDRARRETKGGKNCKLGVFIGGKIVRMVPFPLAPVDAITHASGGLSPTNGSNSEIGFLKDLLLKLIEKSAPAPIANPGPSLADLTGALANLDGLRGKQESAMDLFQKGLEFAQSMNGQTDWKTDLFRTIKDVAPQITGAITSMRGGNPAMTDSTAVPVVTVPPEHVPGIIRAGIAYLKKKAIAGVNPELIIEWVVNNAEEYQEFLRVVLNTEFADIVKFDPEIGTEPFASWFKPLFDGLRREFSTPNPMDDDPGGDTGNGSDPGNNGEPRKAGSKESKG